MNDSNKKRILAIDVGFSHTKLYSEDQQITLSIPSAVAEPMPAMEGFAGGQKLYVLENGTYVFGTDALQPGSQLIHSQDDGWLLRYIPGLICAAANEAGIDLHDIDVISTGLPIQTWRQHKDHLRETLRTIRCNGEVYHCGVEVRPQGVGALGEYSRTAFAESGVVIDIGGMSLLAVMFLNMKPIATNTRQYSRLGVLTGVAQAITPLLCEIANGAKINEIRAMQAVREKKFRQVDISAQVNTALSSYSERLIAEIKTDYREIIPELEQLVVCGGGAHIVGEALKREYPRTVILDQPEFANVRGYSYLSSLAQ